MDLDQRRFGLGDDDRRPERLAVGGAHLEAVQLRRPANGGLPHAALVDLPVSDAGERAVARAVSGCFQAGRVQDRLFGFPRLFPNRPHRRRLGPERPDPMIVVSRQRPESTPRGRGERNRSWNSWSGACSVN